MGRPRRNDCMARAVVTLSLFIFGLIDHLLHVDTSSAAMGATTRSKITREKAPTPYDKPPTKQTQETGQRSLRPRQNSGSPMESDTNSHIATINLNRDRFDNVLTVLGGTSPGKNITLPELPTDPLDDPADLLPPLMHGYNALADEEHPERSRSTVRINDTPTSMSLIASSQAEHERPLSRPGKEGQTEVVQRPILRNSETVLGKDGHNDLTIGRDLEVPVIDKPDENAPPDSPVGVEDGISMPTVRNNTAPADKQAQPVVLITERSPSPPAFESPSTSGDRVARGSVLRNPSPVPPVVDEPPTTRQPLRGLEQGRNYVIDRPNKLYIVYDETGQETRFHVKDFVGLFPSWPIIEAVYCPNGQHQGREDDELRAMLCRPPRRDQTR